MSTSLLPHGDRGLLYRELCQVIIGEFYHVFNEIGSGFRESAYHRAMAIALAEKGLACEREVAVHLRFRGQIIGGYRMDLVVNRAVVLEIKATDRIVPSHHVQVLNYLKSSGHTVGLILNFGRTPSFKRLVCDQNRKSF